MKASPIIFSGEMVRAIRSDQKTQTRRVVKPQPIIPVAHAHVDSNGYIRWIAAEGFQGAGGKPCPYGKPGDYLWARETLGEFSDPVGAEGRYAADQEFAFSGWYWKRPVLPSIHMPRWASRLTLRVTDVRVERLQEISDNDAMSEGFSEWTNTDESPRNRFSLFWVTLYGRESWEMNPWVWVIEFDTVQANVDQVLADEEAA